jgi:hypothetical protein
MATKTASEQIIDAVTAWPGVTAEPDDPGEIVFMVGRRQLGHLHGERVAHFGFPKSVGAELREQGRVVPHPVNPDAPGMAAHRINDEDDIREVIELLRINYDRVAARAET